MSGIGGQGSKLKLPKNWKIHNGHLVGPGQILAGANLNSGKFNGMDLNSIVVTNADLRYADFTNANLLNVNIDGADMAESVLTGVASGGIVGLPKTLPNKWRLRQGYLIGPGANLKGAVLSDATLSGVNLAGANLTGANLTGANLEGAVLTGCICEDIVGLPKALPDGYTILDRKILQNQTLTPWPLVQGVYLEGETLTVSEGSWDTGVRITFQWHRAGVQIQGATNRSYKLSADDVGSLVGVTVTGEKVGFATVQKQSTTSTVEPRRLKLTPKPYVSGDVKVGKTITVGSGIWDSGVEIKFQWLVNGVPALGATSNTFSILSDHFGKTLSVRATGSLAGFPPVTQTSDLVTVQSGNMVAISPKISGSFKPAGSVKALTGPWIKGAKITYQWLANGVAIKGATSSSLKLATSHKGKKISVKVTQSALGYTTASKTSASVTVK